jgi:hypothetical protein
MTLKTHRDGQRKSLQRDLSNKLLDMDQKLQMNSFFETLIAGVIDGKECRTFSESEIPGLAERLMNGIQTEDPVDDILREALTETSEDTLALKISKKDFGDLLLVFKMFTNCKIDLLKPR